MRLIRPRLWTAPFVATLAGAVVLSLALLGDRGSSTADVAPAGLLLLAAGLAVIGAAVADVFDALCSPRVYKAAWSDTDALAEVRRGAGAHFDPSVVWALEAVVARGARLLAA